MANDDLISRQAAIEAIEEYADRLQMVNWKENPGVPYKVHALNWAINKIQDLPSAERLGRWIMHPWGGGVHTCSVCGERAEIVLRNGYITGDASPSGETGGYYHYDRCELLSNNCPNCGARLEVE